MAADGTWSREAEASYRTAEEPPWETLRILLVRLEARLSEGDGAVPAATLRELAQGLDALGRRMARAEDLSAERTADVRNSLARLSGRLEVQQAHSHVLADRLSASEARMAERIDRLEAALEVARRRGNHRTVLLAAGAILALTMAVAGLKGLPQSEAQASAQPQAAVHLGDPTASVSAAGSL